MLKIIKYLKESSGSIILIILLLLLQAFCDLSLPGYTSNIVSVGIQQGGIEDAVPTQIRSEQMDKLFLFMSEDETVVTKDAYTVKDDLYVLNKISKDERTALNEILSKSILAVSSLSGNGDQTVAIKEKMGAPAEADIMEILAQLPKEQLNQIQIEMNEQIDKMPELMITQSAVSFVKAEYQAQGVDLDQLQIRYIVLAGLKMLALALLGAIAAIFVVFLSSKVAAALGRNLRDKVYKKVVSFSSAEFSKFSTASLITRSTNDVQQVQLLMTMIFRIVLYAPILGIGGIMMVLRTNTSMAWIIGLAVILILLVVGLLFAVAMPKFKVLQTLVDKLNLVTREILTGIPVIRAFSTQKHEEKRFEDANWNLTRTNLFVNRCMTFMMPTMMLIMNGITVLIVYKGAVGVDTGAMQVGDLMAFIQYTMQIIMSFLMMTMLSIMLPRASVSAVRISEVIETTISVTDKETVIVPNVSNKGSVEFKNVSFAYPDAKENVLTNISFVAKKGETTAFIGSTGSGKSTLINLIPRFFDVTGGQILLDGVDIRDMAQKDLRARIGYVPQKGVLFSGTIDSNLRYGNEDASPAEIEKAAAIAQALDFINEKEDKFESAISQGGGNVSGGQKQRLSIARAIAKNPEVYIFDDSFSALDYKTDVVLRRALKEETADATTLIVAQRISTILHADQIIVLDEGEVVGIGTHKELLKSCEVYRQVAMSQLSEAELNQDEDTDIKKQTTLLKTEKEV